MKTFKLDNSGDVVINDNKIEYVSGISLVVQTIKQVLGTNLGEWFGDTAEGIDNDVILTKNPNYDLIHDTINTAVAYVGETLDVELETDNFSYVINGRSMDISLTITMAETDETADVTITL